MNNAEADLRDIRPLIRGILLIKYLIQKSAGVAICNP